VKSFHFYQNMSFFEFELPNGTTVETCPAALGHSFAAGTTASTVLLLSSLVATY
jgi:neutral ceramidase